MKRVIESDVCIIGGGITAAMVAERLAERTSASITVVEAGQRTASLAERTHTRARMLAYGENPYPNDHIPGQ
ncbi:MAG: FAD-dependent oxidoreductase, partial [Gemmatimonadetes bacterium]|nr:FAD-dependent oxidoreductase [Gemmatimonadota bacterium]